jgi:hypothetical protein
MIALANDKGVEMGPDLKPTTAQNSGGSPDRPAGVNGIRAARAGKGAPRSIVPPRIQDTCRWSTTMAVLTYGALGKGNQVAMTLTRDLDGDRTYKMVSVKVEISGEDSGNRDGSPEETFVELPAAHLGAVAQLLSHLVETAVRDGTLPVQAVPVQATAAGSLE